MSASPVPARAIRALRRSRPGLFELAVFAAGYGVYFGVRALTEGAVPRAMANAVDLLHIERGLDLHWEDAVQGVVLGDRPAPDRCRGVAAAAANP